MFPKHSLIRVLVFDSRPETEPTLDCPEIRKTPKETAEIVRVHLEQERLVIIRTWNPIALEVIGDLIESGFINREVVDVHYPDGIADYSADGALQNWPYGLFNWTE